jgi:hypothetical protein
MSSLLVDQYVYNIPSNTVIIHGTSKLIDGSQASREMTSACLSSPVTIQLVLNQDVASLFVLDETEITLSLNLICPTDQGVGGSLEYDTSQFFTVNADHPIIRQFIPTTDLEALPPNITIRLPTQKVVKARAVGLTYSKCLDYFQCDDYVLEINFPELVFTSQFNFTIEMKTTNSVDNERFCNQNQLLKANCGKSCFSFISFNGLNQRILLGNAITLSCNQFIICFYPYNRIKTDKGWKMVRNITQNDHLVSHDGQSYKVNRIFCLPVFQVTRFIKFPTGCLKEDVPLRDCYLTPEHMVKTHLGCLNAEQYYRKYKDSHGVEKVDLYSEHIYSFEVVTKTKNIYVDYEGLPSRVWSLEEKDQLKEQLEHFRSSR